MAFYVFMSLSFLHMPTVNLSFAHFDILVERVGLFWFLALKEEDSSLIYYTKLFTYISTLYKHIQ